MKKPVASQILRVACVLALLALGMMVWSLFDPRPIPVVGAMSVGQLVGTLSFVAFLHVVILDLRKPAAPPSARTDAGDQRVE